MSNLFVIGSNAFSGAGFIDYALNKGCEVIGVSRSEQPIEALLPYRWQAPKNIEFHQLDINRHLPEIIKLVNKHKPEYIINYAAQSMIAESWHAPKDWFKTNTVSTIALHHELSKCNFIKRYVHISAPEVYGACAGFIKEDYPLNPSTPYAVSRAATDMSLRTFHSAHQFPVVTTRPGNVYGPGQQLYRIVPRTILFVLLNKKIQLHGGGQSTRSFIHVKDAADATWRIMVKGTSGHTYHISTNNIISIRALVSRICEKLNVNFEDHVEMVEEQLGKDPAYHLDSTKIRQQLDWEDHISLDQGLDECIAWAKKYLPVLKTQEFDYLHKQ